MLGGKRRHLKGKLEFMEQVPGARGSKYNCYFYQTFAGFCNTTLVYPRKQQPEFEEPDDILTVPAFASELHLTVEQMFSWLKVR